MAKGSVFLGIDPGSRVAGYAFLRARSDVVLSPRDFEVLDAGVLRLSESLPYLERVALLHEALVELADARKPHVWIIEKAFADKNVSSAIKLGEVRGSIIAAAFRSGARMEEITPAAVKKRIAGNGRADKDQVAAAVAALLGFQRGKLPHDATDAVAIALAFGLQACAMANPLSFLSHSKESSRVP